METILGIKGADFAMLASDTMRSKSIVVMSDAQPKVYVLSKYSMMAVVGDSGDTIQFCDYISKNLQLYRVQNGYHLSGHAAAHFTRQNLADYLRSKTNYKVSMLLAGFDAEEGPDLHFIDSLGAAQSTNFAGHGYGSMFCGSILNQYWHRHLKQEEGYDILKKCVGEIQKRMVINQQNFSVFVVNKDGICRLEPIISKSVPTDVPAFMPAVL